MQTFYIGIKGLIVQNSKALLLNRKKNNSIIWDLPGGRMEKGEDENKTLLRELKEEIPTIQQIKIEKFLNTYKLPRVLSDGHGLFMLIYKVEAQFPSIELSKEHNGYMWVGIEELKESIPMDPSLKKIILGSVNKF